jgi:hypothetical protein
MQERRLLLRGTQIGKYQSIVLYHRIGAMTDTLGNCAVFRFTRHLENSPINVKQPTVIAAPNTMFSRNSIFKGSATVATVFMQQSETTR